MWAIGSCGQHSSQVDTFLSNKAERPRASEVGWILSKQITGWDVPSRQESDPTGQDLCQWSKDEIDSRLKVIALCSTCCSQMSMSSRDVATMQNLQNENGLPL